jgi:hypothetical protein
MPPSPGWIRHWVKSFKTIHKVDVKSLPIIPLKEILVTVLLHISRKDTIVPLEAFYFINYSRLFVFWLIKEFMDLYLWFYDVYHSSILHIFFRKKKQPIFFFNLWRSSLYRFKPGFLCHFETLNVDERLKLLWTP